jgi:hypothetical protein
MPSIQILVDVEIKVVKLHLEVNKKAHMVDIINMKVFGKLNLDIQMDFVSFRFSF